jgi:hypothetical protein
VGTAPRRPSRLFAQCVCGRRRRSGGTGPGGGSVDLSHSTRPVHLAGLGPDGEKRCY